MFHKKLRPIISYKLRQFAEDPNKYVNTVLTKYAGFKLIELILNFQGIDYSTDNLQRKYFCFPNGFGISVIRGKGTHGNEDGLFEVMPYDDEKGEFTDYPTGWATVGNVLKMVRDLRKVQRKQAESFPLIKNEINSS